MRHKIIAAKEFDGRDVFLSFTNRSGERTPNWLYSNPHEFTSTEDLQQTITHIKADFSNNEGYYSNSRIIVDSLEVQTIGILDTMTISIENSQSDIDRRKALEIINKLDMTLEDLELVVKMARG